MNGGAGNRRMVSRIAGLLAFAWAGLADAAEIAPPAPPAPEPTVVQAAAPASSRGAALAVQGGWWSVEAEWRTRFGIYGAVGIPWMMVPLSVMNGATWVVPFSARLGYDLALSPHWSVRASGHAATMVADENGKCGCAADDPTWRTFLFAEVGIRYQSPSGFVAGADFPLAGLRTPHHGFPPPISLAFTQLYIGRSWGR